VSSDGSIEEQPKDILDLLKDMGKEGGEGEANKEEAPNESLEEQEAFITEAMPKGTKPAAVKKTAGTNTLKIAKMGEESDRVKEIQKTLGLEPTGKFDKATKAAVEAFQTEQKKSNSEIIVDGKVGVQTFGLLLKVKKGLTDESEIEKQLEAFRKAGKNVISVGKGKSIALDPRFYDVFERIEIITNNGTTYVVATPKSDAAEKVEGLKKDNLIGAGFEWLLAAPLAVGKALVYTAVGVTVIGLEVSKAMVNGAIAAGAYVGEKVMSLASNVFYGIGQVAKWANSAASNVWANVKQGANAALGVWKGFTNKAKEVLKASGEGILAFAASVSASFTKASQAFRSFTHQAIMSVGKALNYAWEKTKDLGSLVKSGLTKIGDGVKAIVNKVQTAYTAVVDRAKSITNAVVGGIKSAGQGVINVAKSAVGVVGSTFTAFGNWLTGLSESLEAGNGLMLEWLEY
jgi:peptidoglycan hydrolase-like protein with peptidoglycan-binding domain